MIQPKDALIYPEQYFAERSFESLLINKEHYERMIEKEKKYKPPQMPMMLDEWTRCLDIIKKEISKRTQPNLFN